MNRNENIWIDEPGGSLFISTPLILATILPEKNGYAVTLFHRGVTPSGQVFKTLEEAKQSAIAQMKFLIFQSLQTIEPPLHIPTYSVVIRLPKWFKNTTTQVTVWQYTGVDADSLEAELLEIKQKIDDLTNT